MRIDTLAGNTVKITLEPSDMDGCNIKYEDISGRSHETELALSRLISSVCEKHGLKLSGERLLVEAFPKCDGGCTLYVSCLKSARQKPSRPSCEDNRIVICSGRLSDIAALCRILRKKREKASSQNQDGKDRCIAAERRADRCCTRGYYCTRCIAGTFRKTRTAFAAGSGSIGF